jgi:hypothetical protein
MYKVMEAGMDVTTYRKASVKVADEFFLILALLHREQPDRRSFRVSEILKRALQEGLRNSDSNPGSLRAHASSHAIANEPPGKGGKYRIAYRENNGQVRLLEATDYVHPERSWKFYPSPDQIPEKYHELLNWAKQRSRLAEAQAPEGWLEGVRQLRGLGRELWKGVDPDAYVSSLREGWD